MSEPSVKGIVFLSAVDSVRHLTESGLIRRDTVTDALEPGDLQYLESPIVPTLWYPVGVAGRYLELLWEIEGKRQPAYMVERGAAAAERIFTEGTYARMIDKAKSWGGNQVARALINLGAQLYNFMRWELVGNFYEDEYTVEVHDAAEWPDVLRFGSEGFIETLHSRASDRSLSVTSRRPTPDRVVFEVVVKH